MSSIKNFEDLVPRTSGWQLLRKLSNDIYIICTSTLFKNDFKLRNQINGSSGSIMDNIAKKFERNGNKKFRQFLSISKASCGETRSQLYRNYIDEKTFLELKELNINNS